MRLYSAWAFIKIFFWLTTLSILYNYVNVYEHTSLWLWFWFLWVFLLIRWLGYFFFLSLWTMLTSYDEHIKTSASYKLSLMLWVYAIVNLTFMIIDNRNSTIWVWLIVVFVLLQYLIASDFRKQQKKL